MSKNTGFQIRISNIKFGFQKMNLYTLASVTKRFEEMNQNLNQRSEFSIADIHFFLEDITYNAAVYLNRKVGTI